MERVPPFILDKDMMVQPNSATISPALTPVCVILPTYNRIDVLPLCLDCLEKQSFRDFEVVLVDDGSTDGTAAYIEHYLLSTPLPVRHVRLENGGPARARNVAISLTQAPLLVFIGDDILASPDFLSTHVRFHRSNPEPATAALGLTKWSETGQTVTPFMRWLDNGFQFDYINLLKDTTPDWRHFYTSNLSIKSDLLRRHHFDERFKQALMEDAELGYRLFTLEQLRLVFLPDAVAEHIHPTDFTKACRRAFAIGRNALLFDAAVSPSPPRGGLRGLLRRTLSRKAWPLHLVSAFTAQLTRFWVPTYLTNQVLSFHLEAGRNSAS